MKLLLVDFDGTLIQTEPFVAKIYGELKSKFNIDPIDIRGVLDNNSDKYGITDWTPIYSQVATVANTSAENIKAIVYDSMSSIQYNQQIVDLTKKFEGFKVLFSYGETEFQLAKINKVGANDLVNNIFITIQPKIVALSDLIEENTLNINDQQFTDVTLIDDKEIFLTEVKQQFPFIKIINATELLKEGH